MITATIKSFFTQGDLGVLFCTYSLSDDQDPSFTPSGQIQVDQSNPQGSVVKQLSAIVDQANITQSLKPLIGATVTSQNPAPVPVPKPTGPLQPMQVQSK